MKKIKPFILNTIFIVLGAFIIALGINVFLASNKISSGGVSSIGTIFLHLFNVKMSVTNIAINTILFLFGFKYLNKESIIKTIIGIIALTCFLELTSYIPIYSENIMLSTIVGGVLVGIGLGFVIKQSASTGGSDFAAMIIKRVVPHISLAHIIFVLDCAVIIVSGIVFKSITITIYSIIAMYIASMIADTVVTFGNKSKAVQIFSDKTKEIAEYIIDNFERGATGVHCKGMYSNKEKLMLFCVVSPKELPLLIKIIKKTDNNAFVIINDAKEVLGEGFGSYSEYEDIDIPKVKKTPQK